MKEVLALFKTRRFLPLFITQFLGAFNDNIFKNALAVLITYRLSTQLGFNPQILVVMAAGIFILPFFLFSATAGQLADKYEKSMLIRIIKSIEIILMLVATLGFYLQSISLLMLVLFSLGAHATFFGPLKYAILPEHLHENELIAGNGLIEAGTFIAILLGTILGGILILCAGGSYIISVAICIVATVGLLASLKIPETKNYNPNLIVNYNIVTETVKLIKYSKQNTDIFLCILGISWFWLFGAVFLSEFPAFAKDILHANEKIYTYFLALFSIGLALGSVLCNRLLKGEVNATYAPLGILGMTIFTIDLYFASKHSPINVSVDLINLVQFLSTMNGWRISFDLLMAAACGGIYTVPLYAIMQHKSEKSHRARIIASNNVMNALFMVVASLATILMLKLGFTVIDVFLTVAIVNGFVAIYICKLLPDILVKGFFRWILTLLYKVEVKGLEHYKQAGERVVIIANHTSFIDALLLGVFLPDNLTFAVNTNIAQKWWVKIFIKLVATYPVDPTKPMMLKSLIEFVQQDKRCVIFPEGRLSMTGALMKIYEGPGLVADKSNAPLLPIRIQGAQYTPFSRLRGKVRIRWMPKITITIFPAQKLEFSSDIKGRMRRQKIGNRLYDLMAAIMFESSDYRKTLFTSLIDAQLIHGSRNKMLEDIDRVPINYKQMMKSIFVLGNVIAKSSQPDEVVGVLLPNMNSNVLTFFALQAYSRVPAMLNYSAGISNVLHACHIAKISTVCTSRRFIELAKLNDLIDALKQKSINIIFLEDVRQHLRLIDKIKGMLYSQFPRLAYKSIHSSQTLFDPDQAAVVLFTSGSEGTPKGVVLSHANILANCSQLSACVDFVSTDKVFNALPLFHSFGLTGGMLLPLLSGVKVFLYPSPLHYRIVPELTYDTDATIIFGTDTFLSGYARCAHPYDFYSVRYVFAGAEKLKDETQKIWSQKFGLRVFEGYGATETSPVISTNTQMQNKPGTVGKILPGMEYRLESINGIDDGGVLHISGPNVMKGYLLANEPGVVVACENGWYNTGDVVDIDEQGFITIKGRVKRFAKIAGEMVSLTMVEQLVAKLWPTYEHAVISIPDEKKGEQLILVTTNLDAKRDELVNYAKANYFAEIAIPKKIIIQKKMPLLGTGKVDYTAVKQMINISK